MATLSPQEASSLAQGLRAAAEIGNVTSVRAIAAELPVAGPYTDRIAALADALDMDGIMRLADEMERDSRRK